MIALLLTLALPAHATRGCEEIAHMVELLGAPATQALLQDGSRYAKSVEDCVSIASGEHDVVPTRLRLRIAEVDERDATPLESLQLMLGCGTVRVRGSAGPGLRIRGRTDEADLLELIRDEAHLRVVQMASTEMPYPRCMDLVVEVQRDARLLVEANGDLIQIHDVDGPVEVETRSAAVTVTGTPSSTIVRAVAGPVRVDTAHDVEVETGDGRIEVASGPGSTVRTKSVSGHHWVHGGPYARVALESLSGEIRFQGSMDTRGLMDVFTHGGDVILGLPDTAELDLRTLTDRSKRPEAAPNPVLRAPDSRSINPHRRMRPRVELGCTFDCLSPENRGLWRPDDGWRNWFEEGVRLHAVHPATSEDARIRVRTFNGKVHKVELEQFPSATGSYLTAARALQRTLVRCDVGKVPPARVQGSWTVGPDGTIRDLVLVPDGVEDPAIPTCLEEGIGKASFPKGATVQMRWAFDIGWPADPE